MLCPTGWPISAGMMWKQQPLWRNSTSSCSVIWRPSSCNEETLENHDLRNQNEHGRRNRVLWGVVSSLHITLPGGYVLCWGPTCALKGMEGHSCRYDAWSEHNEVYGLICKCTRILLAFACNNLLVVLVFFPCYILTRKLLSTLTNFTTQEGVKPSLSFFDVFSMYISLCCCIRWLTMIC